MAERIEALLKHLQKLSLLPLEKPTDPVARRALAEKIADEAPPLLKAHFTLPERPFVANVLMEYGADWADGAYRPAEDALRNALDELKKDLHGLAEQGRKESEEVLTFFHLENNKELKKLMEAGDVALRLKRQERHISINLLTFPQAPLLVALDTMIRHGAVYYLTINLINERLSEWEGWLLSRYFSFRNYYYIQDARMVTFHLYKSKDLAEEAHTLFRGMLEILSLVISSDTRLLVLTSEGSLRELPYTHVRLGQQPLEQTRALVQAHIQSKLNYHPQVPGPQLASVEIEPMDDFHCDRVVCIPYLHLLQEKAEEIEMYDRKDGVRYQWVNQDELKKLLGSKDRPKPCYRHATQMLLEKLADDDSFWTRLSMETPKSSETPETSETSENA